MLVVPPVALLPFPLAFFFFNDTATTEIYTLSLHDALPILKVLPLIVGLVPEPTTCTAPFPVVVSVRRLRSEEHTSELQSPCNIACRLLLEKRSTAFLIEPDAPLLRK